MLPFEDRYSRQRRLPEVGAEGQRRLAQTRLTLAEHAGVQVEQDYLVRAGVASAEPAAAAPGLDFPWTDEFEFAASRDLARGAWSALYRIREALGVGSR